MEKLTEASIDEYIRQQGAEIFSQIIVFTQT